MRKLFIVAFFLTLVNFYLFASYLYPELSSINLSLIDKQALALSEELVRHPLVKQKGTSFMVYYGFYDFSYSKNGNAFTIQNILYSHGVRRNTVFLTPKIVKSKYLKVAVAHELGHINESTRDELEADKFAVNLLGDKNFVINGLLHFGIPEDSERIIALSDKSPAK